MEDSREELQIQLFADWDHVTKVAMPPSGGASHFHFAAFEIKKTFKRLNPQKQSYEDTANITENL